MRRFEVVEETSDSEEAIPQSDLARKAHPFRSFGLERPQIDVAASFERMRAHYRLHAALWEAAAEQDAAMAPLLARVREKLSGNSPALGTIEEETAIAAVLGYREYWSSGYVEDDAIDRCVALGGLPFAVTTALGAQDWFPAHRSVAYAFHFERGEIGSFHRLRRHLASAPEEEWIAAREVAREIRAGAPLSVRVSIAYLFPEVTEWANADADEVLERQIDERWPGALLMTSVDPGLAARLIDVIAQPSRGIPCIRIGGADVVGAACSMIAAHGSLAAPALLKLFDKTSEMSEWRRDVAAALALLPSDDAFRALVSRLELREVIPLAIDAAHRFPHRAVRVLAPLAGRGQPLVDTILADVKAETVEAGVDDLPRVLARPPWNEKKKTAASKPLQLPTFDAPVEVLWPAGMKDEWANERTWTASRHGIGPTDGAVLSLNGLYFAGVFDEIDDATLRARIAEFEATKMEPWRHVSASDLSFASERLALAVWDTLPLERWSEHDDSPRPFLARFGAKAFPTLLRYVAASPGRRLELLIPFRAPAAAPLVADALARLKSARPAARRWLLLHAETAAIGLIPQAVGPRGAARDAAADALRFLAANGHEAIVMSTAARYGAGAAAAVREVLDFDPLLLFPSKLPKLPLFRAHRVYIRPRLRKDGAVLPDTAMDALIIMLAFSSLSEPYAGIADVKETCEPASLAAFASDAFQAWLSAGAPSEGAWALHAVGHFGDDECARRLAPLIREWPGEAAHARAVTGLDVLAAIGSDVALMHLNGIAQKAKFKGIQEKAREKIAALAERRGLTAEDLADRLVPDLGLEDDGSMTLDFGPRSFRVGFDEHLSPSVKDAEGKKLPDLPKPGRTDDSEKAHQATARWKALKKDAKTLASQQILRLETAMCTRRRFDAGVFRQFFVEHPLVQHLARRIVWGAYDDGRLLSTFRVSEDRTFADANDDAYELPGNARAGVVHPYEMTDDVAAAWGQLFADYELLQPFRQLGREVYRPTDEERAAKQLTRWTGVTVPTGKVLGLDQRGWRRGPPGDGGVSTWYLKPLPSGHEVRLELDPGIQAGAALGDREQTLGEVTIERGRGGGWGKEGVMAFGELDPIVFSEVVRDLEGLRS